jgi:glutathione synthase
MSTSIYPPQLSSGQLSSLIANVRDWQYTHGSLLKAPPDTGQLSARPIGVSLFPSIFPKARFEEARALQVPYNELYAAVAGDEDWLFEVLKEYDSLILITFLEIGG